MIGDVRTTDEAGLAIDDQQLAMGAVIDLRPAIPAQRVIPAHLSAGSAQSIEVGVRGAKAAQRIHNDADLDPSSGAFGQCSQHLIADLSRLEFVVFEVNGVLCPADGLKLSGVEFDSVL